MNKFLHFIFLLLCAFLFACQTMPERQLARMQKYYIEPCSGGKIFFDKYANSQNIYSIVDKKIEKELNSLGYTRVQNIKDAQFTLSPRYYPESFEYPDPFANKPDEISLSNQRGTALNFSIRVKSISGNFLTSCDTRLKIIPETLSSANIERQVEWSLRHFPICEAKSLNKNLD